MNRKLLLVLFVLLTMQACATVPPSPPDQTVAAVLIAAVGDWSLSGMGWYLYFDGYAPAFYKRTQLILRLDPAVQHPIGRFQATAMQADSACSQCFAQITFRSKEQIKQYLDINLRTLTVFE